MTAAPLDVAPEYLTRSAPFELTRADDAADGLTLDGYAAMFGRETYIDSWEGSFIERIAPGAFRKSIRERTPRMQFDHGHHPLIGSIPIGVITELSEDARGLHVVGRLSDNWLIEPVRDAIRAGAIDGMSFRFRVVRESWTDAQGKAVRPEDLRALLYDAGDRGPLTRTLKEVRVDELGPVVWPAYEATSVDVRARSLAHTITDDEELRRQVRRSLTDHAAVPGDLDDPQLRRDVARALLFTDASGTRRGATMQDITDEQRRHLEREEQLKAIRTAYTDPTMGRIERGTPFGAYPDEDTRPHRAGPIVGEARRSIDQAARSGLLPDYAAERATRLVERGSIGEQTLAARWAVTAGDPAYLSAFAKVVADRERGHMLWTPEEQEAYRRAAEVRAVMGLGATAGAEMVPLTLDPAIMLTSTGSTNPLRRISRVVQTVTDQWKGVTSAGATAEWKAEHAEAADGGPVLGEAAVDVFLGDVDVTYSYEVGQDALDFLGELQRVMNDAAEQLQATAFTTGTGVGQPAGVITGATTVVNTAGAFAATHVYATQNALPPRFQANAQWAGNLAVINQIAQFETTAGSLKFPEVGDGRLLRRPLNELSNMTADMTTANSKFLLYGDFQHFVIADRIGAMLEILPGYGANRRPTAERHAFLTFRTGSKVVVPEAFRTLTKTV